MIDLMQLKLRLEAAYDLCKMFGAITDCYINQHLSPNDQKLLKDAWVLLGDGEDSMLSFAGKVRKECAA